MCRMTGGRPPLSIRFLTTNTIVASLPVSESAYSAFECNRHDRYDPDGLPAIHPSNIVYGSPITLHQFHRCCCCFLFFFFHFFSFSFSLFCLPCIIRVHRLNRKESLPLPNSPACNRPLLRYAARTLTTRQHIL